MSVNWIVCCNCGIDFGIPTEFDAERRRYGKKFYCPNGHSLSYEDTDLDRIQRERDRLKQRLAEKDDAIRSLENQNRAQKAATTRIKNRIGAGVCPCCSRTFQNLHRHMQSQHPSYRKEEAA